MLEKFNPQEILKIAVAVEENGRKLYENLEKKAKGQELKQMWKHLKDQEAEHIKVFEQMLENLKDYLVVEFNPGEYEGYLKAISFEFVFTRQLIEEKITEGFSSEVQALNFGIHIEKKSILVYSALRDYLLQAKQPVLDKVIEEEKKHLIELTEFKKRIEEK
ncbi:MAG: ferritin family protein [Candidatus Omnitrophica bacterium]|nr:ferritin family protein [Candidatus Omnitrophota bacterium]MDD5430062.1 ferritin family protein [Candidatus Omnitrophota bacterium]